MFYSPLCNMSAPPSSPPTRGRVPAAHDGRVVPLHVDGSGGVVDGRHVHCEAQHEYRKDDQEPAQVHDQLPDDDSPGSKEVVK